MTVARRRTAVEKAEAGWGSAPDWVLALAQACDRDTQAVVARRIAYSAPTVSQVISNSYPGDIHRIEQMVRGALMSSTVDCPVKGELRLDACLAWQRKPFAPTSSERARMYRACRAGCPFSKINEVSDAAE